MIRCGIMRPVWIAIFTSLLLTSSIKAQTPTEAMQGLPTDSREVFKAAAALYDFSDPKQKPWHMKVSYQIYNEKGEQKDQGTFEYWWASPDVYRTTWTRGGSVHSEWHLAGGKHAYVGSGPAMEYFEYRLRTALLAPIPSEEALDPAKVHLQKDDLHSGKLNIPCYMLVPNNLSSFGHKGALSSVPSGLFPTYCFDPAKPILHANYSWGAVLTEYDRFSLVQSHVLPKQVDLYENGKKTLSAQVGEITGISASEEALVPPPGEVKEGSNSISLDSEKVAEISHPRVQPVYPIDAKREHITGTVKMKAIIGKDGGIHDLQVISAPWPSLVESAISAVSRWRYKPYLVKGDPVEVNTEINVVYFLP